MISKLIVWAENRDESIARMKRALYEYKITGVKTSIKFLERIMDTKDFRSGNYDTNFIEKNKEELLEIKKHPVETEDMIIIASYIEYLDQMNVTQISKKLYTAQNRWKNYTYQKNFERL
jgi:acetyl-CoA carboxylase biotin carboxylase subunit